MAGIEFYKRLDIRRFHKFKCLRPGLSFSWQWTRDSAPTGDIVIKTESGYILLLYRYRYGGEEWQDVTEKIYLDCTPCNYGGKRPWFLCPGCGRRVGILAAAGKLFLCRHCYRLKYWSQLATDLDRAKQKVCDLMLRQNSKGLHQKTRHRLQRKLNEAIAQKDELLLTKVRKFLIRADKRLSARKVTRNG